MNTDAGPRISDFVRIGNGFINNIAFKVYPLFNELHDIKLCHPHRTRAQHTKKLSHALFPIVRSGAVAVSPEASNTSGKDQPAMLEKIARRLSIYLDRVTLAVYHALTPIFLGNKNDAVSWLECY